MLQTAVVTRFPGNTFRQEHDAVGGPQDLDDFEAEENGTKSGIKVEQPFQAVDVKGDSSMAGRIQHDNTARCDMKVQVASTATAAFGVEELPTHRDHVEELDRAEKETRQHPIGVESSTFGNQPLA